LTHSPDRAPAFLALLAAFEELPLGRGRRDPPDLGGPRRRGKHTGDVGQGAFDQLPTSLEPLLQG
jgi:hypothetical protein